MSIAVYVLLQSCTENDILSTLNYQIVSNYLIVT